MRLSDNNVVQLWRKAEAHARNATNLMLSDVPSVEALGEVIDKTLEQLKAATECMQLLKLRSDWEAKLTAKEPEEHHPKCGCAVCRNEYLRLTENDSR